MDIRLLILGSCLVAFIGFAVQLSAVPETGKRWEFYSEYGQSVEFQKDEEGYSFFSGDVGELDVNCPQQLRNYRVCLNSTFVSLAIPTVRPNLGDSWEIVTRQGKANFEVEWIGKKIDWLGESFEDVYVILTTEIEMLGGDKLTKASRVWFSYDNGLIAFQVNTDYPVRFIVSDLPSLGATD